MEPYRYVYKPYQSGQINYPSEETSIQIEADEDSSLATMIASEASLAKDWSTSDEDEVWRFLEDD